MWRHGCMKMLAESVCSEDRAVSFFCVRMTERLFMSVSSARKTEREWMDEHWDHSQPEPGCGCELVSMCEIMFSRNPVVDAHLSRSRLSLHGSLCRRSPSSGAPPLPTRSTVFVPAHTSCVSKICCALSASRHIDLNIQINVSRGHPGQV